jgi:hypothetical protein
MQGMREKYTLVALTRAAKSAGHGLLDRANEVATRRAIADEEANWAKQSLSAQAEPP